MGGARAAGGQPFMPRKPLTPTQRPRSVAYGLGHLGPQPLPRGERGVRGSAPFGLRCVGGHDEQQRQQRLDGRARAR